ncbi:hypothetical protein [Streptomyces sp. NPDC048659]|uniref:hypothetical protein n=1 Tax=Streptomyces sp. NPDC048659 TaxID=3155489 RepID=UPI0034246271
MYRAPTGLGRLLRILPFSITPASAWVITGVGSHRGIVVLDSVLYAPIFRYCGSVRDATMYDAISRGFVEIGAEEPVPEYDEARGPWRWEDGRTGRPISVTDAGRRATWER